MTLHSISGYCLNSFPSIQIIEHHVHRTFALWTNELCKTQVSKYSIQSLTIRCWPLLLFFVVKAISYKYSNITRPLSENGAEPVDYKGRMGRGDGKSDLILIAF